MEGQIMRIFSSNKVVEVCQWDGIGRDDRDWAQ